MGYPECYLCGGTSEAWKSVCFLCRFIDSESLLGEGGQKLLTEGRPDGLTLVFLILRIKLSLIFFCFLSNILNYNSS